MIFWRDVMAIGVAAGATAALGAWFILPNIYPAREPLGYVAGTIQSYEIRVGKLSARGTFDVRLDRGEMVRVIASDVLPPGERVCLRASRRGELVEGDLVPMKHCPGG